MDRKLIKKLVLASYTHGDLDEKKVIKIAKILKKGDLKLYIKALKANEMQNTVIVSTTLDKTKELKNHLSDVFKDKKIIVEYDKSLIAGVKIQDFDNIYELNLKNKIKNLIKFIGE